MTGGITLSGTSVSLTAPAISIPGAVDGSTSVSLVANNGTIDETGSVTTTTLTGSATGATSLSGCDEPAPTRSTTLGSFSAAGFTLNDGLALAVAGPVNGGSSATILDAAALTVNGSVVSTQQRSSLTGSSIAITGTAFVTDGGSGTTSLVATGGTISETGTLIAGTLSGSSTGATSLTGATTTTNQVGQSGQLHRGRVHAERRYRAGGGRPGERRHQRHDPRRRRADGERQPGQHQRDRT